MIGNLPESTHLYAEVSLTWTPEIIVCATLIPQEIPIEELEAAEKDDAKIVNLFHYAKDPTRTHGVPCKFVVYENEPFEETKKRIQSRIGAADKDFSRFKFSLVTATVFKQPSAVEDREWPRPFPT